MSPETVTEDRTLASAARRSRPGPVQSTKEMQMERTNGRNPATTPEGSPVNKPGGSPATRPEGFPANGYGDLVKLEAHSLSYFELTALIRKLLDAAREHVARAKTQAGKDGRGFQQELKTARILLSRINSYACYQRNQCQQVSREVPPARGARNTHVTLETEF